MKTVKHRLKMWLKRFLWPFATKYGSTYLPLFRSNQDLKHDFDYMYHAITEILRIHCRWKQIHDGSTILDFGCGQGRLAQGLIDQHFDVNYLGIDTDKWSIKWCRKFIARYNSGYKFWYIPAYNARYNTKARGVKRLGDPLANDIILCNSVFTHMLHYDIEYYLSEFYRILKPDGIIYMTAFTDPELPDPCWINPPGYKTRSKSPLHRVVYNHHYFEDMIEQVGFTIIDQSAIIERSEQRIFILAHKSVNKDSL